MSDPNQNPPRPVNILNYIAPREEYHQHRAERATALRSALVIAITYLLLPVFTLAVELEHPGGPASLIIAMVITGIVTRVVFFAARKSAHKRAFRSGAILGLCAAFLIYVAIGLLHSRR